MTNWIWTPGADQDWFDPANWTADPAVPVGPPRSGDTAVIAAGTALVGPSFGSTRAVTDITLVLGGEANLGDPVGLTLAGAFLDRVTMTVASGADDPATPLVADLDVIGISRFQGRLEITAQGGGLEIDLSPTPRGAPGVLELADDTTLGSGDDSLIALAQQSTLTVRGGTIENDGFIQIEGIARFAADTSIVGEGRIEVEDGGTLRVAGAVGSGQALVLPDGTARVVLADPESFAGTLQLTPTSGAEIVLRGLDVASVQLVAPGIVPPGGPVQPFTLLLLDAAGETLMGLPVELVNPNSLDLLPQAQQSFNVLDFTLDDLGDRGTRLVYTPHQATLLTTSLPVPVIAAAGTVVPLSEILLSAFGTATPDFPVLTLLPTTPLESDTHYWGQPATGGARERPVWLVNGEEITGVTVVNPGDDVALKVGNNVDGPPQMMAQVTPDGLGPDAVFLTYNIWTVAPKAAPVPTLGGPTAADVVASAALHATVYAGAVNTELCNWIADNIAAAAGATMPFPNASLSTQQNAEGGFWRIAYRSSDTDTPVEDWSGLVQAGDIVRMQWTTQSGHTTTVVGAYDAGTGKIMVYDNIGPASSGDELPGKTTAIHPASYWTMTDPEGITIYRLAEEPQYLIKGTTVAEFIQGTVFDDLIRSGGGQDTIALGPGADEIEGGLRDLRGDVLRGFDAEDVIHVTDLAFAGASLRLRGETLLLFSGGERVGSIDLDGIAPGTAFTLASDGGAGTLLAIDTVLA